MCKIKVLTFRIFYGIMVFRMGRVRPNLKRTETMQELYNCHRIDDTHYKITKFDGDLNPVHTAVRNSAPRLASYVCSHNSCDCPAGQATSCRHRKMLPIFISNKKVDTNYFFIWDQHDWYKAPGIPFEDHIPPTEMSGWENTLLDPKADLDNPKRNGGGAQAPVSEVVPSPQPSPAPVKSFRRF